VPQVLSLKQSTFCMVGVKNWITIRDKNDSELYASGQQYLMNTPMENTHSILQAQTKPSDMAEKLTNRTKNIFGSKQRQDNFRSIFTPPKQIHFPQQQLQFNCKSILFLHKQSKLLINHAFSGTPSQSQCVSIPKQDTMMRI
jgi:hypothetical protein